MSVTLTVARQEVSKRAQEFVMGTASSGSTTSVADTTNLSHVDGYWDETLVLFTSGANLNLQRRVQTFTAAASTLTLYQSVTSAVASGDTYELYRRFSPNDVQTAINRAINIGVPDFREKVRYETTLDSSNLKYTFPSIPTLYDKGLVSVEMKIPTAPSTWPFQKLSPDQYEILENWDTTNNIRNQVIQLRFIPFTNAMLRLVYDGPLGNVSSPTDVIHLDLPELEWLYTQSVTELWRIEASRTTEATRKDALEELARWEGSADKLRRQLGMQQPERPLRRTRFSITGGGWPGVPGGVGNRGW